MVVFLLLHKNTNGLLPCRPVQSVHFYEATWRCCEPTCLYLGSLSSSMHANQLWFTVTISAFLHRIFAIVFAYLPPASVVKVIELVPSVCVRVSVIHRSHSWTVWHTGPKFGNVIGPICLLYICVCLNPSQLRDFSAKGLYIRETQEVRERSGVFIASYICNLFCKCP